MLDRFEAIQALIAANPERLAFAEFGDGASSYRIESAERELGFPLPESYKWWLRNYGGGEILGEEIYSVYDSSLTDAPSGDIVFQYRLHLKSNPKLRDRFLPICHSDIDGLFYFDLETLSVDGEYRVWSQSLDAHYADEFLEFLTKRIEMK